MAAADFDGPVYLRLKRGEVPVLENRPEHPFRIGAVELLRDGTGTIGLLLVMLARRAGASLVIVSDPNPRKRELALEVGADIAVDPGTERAAERIRQLCGGRGADVAFEAVGTTATCLETLAAVRFGGTAVLVGISSPTAEAPVPLFDVLRRDLTIEAVWLRRFTFQRAVALLPHLPVDRLLSHSVSLARISEGLELLRSGKAVKVVVER
jgi:L-iditol 2-dehydrogenase